MSPTPWYRELPASDVEAALTRFWDAVADGWDPTEAELADVREAQDWLAEAID